MPNYPRELYLQSNLRLTEKRTVRNDARLSGLDHHAGPTAIPNYSIPLLEWINERILAGDIPYTPVPDTPLTVIDTSSINFTASGTDDHTLTGSVKISATSGNQISISSDGLYVPQVSVPSQTPLTVVDTSTIDFSTSGTNSHTLTGSVIIPGLISSDASNQVTTGTDGKLFVPVPSSTTVTANNGLTKTVNNIQLGGDLVQNTSITGNFDIYFGNKNYIFGDDNSLIGATGIKFAHKLTKSLNSLSGGFSTNYKVSNFTIDTGFSLPGGQGLFNDNNATILNINNSKEINYSAKAANQTSYTAIRGIGTPTLTMSSLNGNIGVYANHLTALGLDNTTNNAANKVTITHFANYYSFVSAQNTEHNAVTNFYHIFLADTTNNLANPSYIANKYGIYQEGTLDKNVFFGDIVLGSTTFVASAKLKIDSTTQGFLPPRMTSTNKNNIVSPAEGLLIYDTTLHKLCVRTASAWETITSI